MKRRIGFILLLLAMILLAAVLVSRCGGRRIDYPVAIMVDGETYYKVNPPRIVDVDEDQILGTVRSYTKTFPKKDGQTNFDPSKTSRYAEVDGGIAVSIGDEWYLFETRDS